MTVQRPGLTVLTQARFEPITLEEARLWCRVDADDTSEDWILLLLIEAARDRAEDLTGLAVARQSLEWTIDTLPDGDVALEIPRPPLVSLDYITYLDLDGAWQTLAGSPDNWVLDTTSTPARVTPLYGANWPTVREQIGAVKIGFTSGYITSSQMPPKLLLWLQQRIATWYCYRDTLSEKAINEMPRDYVDGLLDHLRFSKFFA